MATSDWTTSVEAVVNADLNSVVSWWALPERLEERRSWIHSLPVKDLVHNERVEDGKRIATTSYVAPSGLNLFLEVVSPTNQSKERDAEGKVVFRHDTYQYRRWPNGREERSRGDTVLEFSDIEGSATRLRMTQRRQKEGVRWWERWLPPNDDRHHQLHHLRELASRCERDLMVTDPGRTDTALDT